MPFFILFILIPMSEIMIFMKVSDHIGLGTALLMALFTAVLGGFVVRYQGLKTMMSAQASLQSGALPSKELFDGLCLVIAGAVLITPGFITDALGFALLIPPVRDALRRKMEKSARFQSSSFRAEYQGFEEQHSYREPQDPNVIDAEFETLDTQNIDEDKTDEQGQGTQDKS